MEGCVLLAEVATELYGIETAELLTRAGIPLNGDTALPEDVFDLVSVGDSVVGTRVDNNGDVVVVGEVGDDKELKNAALAALFWVETSDGDLSFSDLPEVLLF